MVLTGDYQKFDLKILIILSLSDLSLLFINEALFFSSIFSFNTSKILLFFIPNISIVSTTGFSTTEINNLLLSIEALTSVKKLVLYKFFITSFNFSLLTSSPFFVPLNNIIVSFERKIQLF